MEKKAFEMELKGSRVAILITGIVSWVFMVFSEYGDKAFRWSLIALIVGITIFMYGVTTFLLYSISNK
jgi:hypothetical protein